MGIPIDTKDRAEIVRLWNLGTCAKVIGAQLNRSPNSVKSCARLLGLVRRPACETWPANDARLRSLWDSGMPTRQIGIEIGVTKSSVIGRAHRLNLSPRSSPIRREEPVLVASVNQVELFGAAPVFRYKSPWPENDQLLRELWAHGYSASEIGRRIGNLNKNAIRMRAMKLGLPKQVSAKSKQPAAWPSRDPELLALIARGLGWDDIQVIMSIPRASVIKRASLIKPDTFLITAGMRFGRRVVSGAAEPDSNGRERWVMLCDCGNRSAALANALRSGRSTVCMSCSVKEATAKRATNHPPKPVIVPAPVARAPLPEPVVVAAPAVPAIAIIRAVSSYSSAGPLPVLRKCDWVTSNCRPWTRCGGETIPGKPYCAGHCAVAYVQHRPRDMRAA